MILENIRKKNIGVIEWKVAVMQPGFISVRVEMDGLKRVVKDVKLDKPDLLANVQEGMAEVKKG